MKCKQCPEGRRFARGSVECPYYGIIIRENHEGTRERCISHEGDQLPAGSYADNPATELQEERWPDFDSLPGILSEA